MGSVNLIQRIGLLLGPVVFTLTLLYFHPEGLSKEANAVLASTFWIAIWWITEAIPIAVTVLIPIVLFPPFRRIKLSRNHKFFRA